MLPPPPPSVRDLNAGDGSGPENVARGFLLLVGSSKRGVVALRTSGLFEGRLKSVVLSSEVSPTAHRAAFPGLEEAGPAVKRQPRRGGLRAGSTRRLFLCSPRTKNGFRFSQMVEENLVWHTRFDVSVHKGSSIGTRPRLLLSILGAAALGPWQQSGVLVAEPLRAAEPKIWTVWPLTGNLRPLL